MINHAPPSFSLPDSASVCLANRTATMLGEPSRVLIGSTILFFSLISLLLNFLVVAAIAKSWIIFRGQPFTQFVLSMILAGSIYTSVNFFVSIPCTISYCEFLSDDTFLIVFSLPNTLSFIAYLLANFGFAIYRTCIVFDLLKNYRRMLHLTTLLLPWILAVYTVIDTSLRGCIKRFNRWSMGYTYNCSECNVWFGISFIDINFYAGQVLPIMMCVMYGVMIISIYWQKSNNHFQRKSTSFDIKLAFQYLLICLVQYLASFLFYVIPKFGSGGVLQTMALNCIGVINMASTPLVLLVFNSNVRSATVTLLSCCPCVRVPIPKVSTATMFPRRSNHSKLSR